MKNSLVIRLASTLAVLLVITGCGSSAVSVSGITGSFVDSFSVSGQVILPGATNAQIGNNSTTYNTDSFADSRIVEVIFNAKFVSVTSSAKVGSDDYRDDVYSAISKATTLTAAGQTITSIYGFWPKTASKTSATHMTMIYVVPSSTQASDLKWTVDGTTLGDATYQFSFTDFTEANS